MVVNQMRNIWKIKNPKIYTLYNMIMSLLQGIRFYIEHISSNKAIEVTELAIEARDLVQESDEWLRIKEEWGITNQDLYFPAIWKQAN